ncbi:hypothetical protein MBLNU13_g07082t1 [Cladosporium sp. NU13]
MSSSMATGALSFAGTTKLRDPADRPSNGAGVDDSHKRNKFTDYSNIRVPGGKAAGPKPIKANYDADDARIVDLKQQGYSDEYVARKLKDEGRIRYVPRTIGSRWLRIRKALEAKEEEILEDEMSDWHDGEDQMLEKAVQEIDKHIEKEIAKLQNKKWAQVASHFADLIQKKKYTQKLCRERYDSLMDGTAIKPIELDSDQEGRAEMRRTRIFTNKRLREEAAAAQQLEEERKAAARAAKKKTKAANVAASAAQRKTVKLRIRQWNAYNRTEASWLSRKQHAERILQNKLLGLALSYRPPRTKRIQFEEPQYEEEKSEQESEEDEIEDDEDTIVVAHTTRKHRRSSGSVSDNPAPRKKKAGTKSPVNATRTSPRLSKSASPKQVAIGEAPVTAEVRPSPRFNMTIADINDAFSVRDLPKVSGQETREQAVARLEMSDQLATTQDLKSYLKAHGLNSNGKSKGDLIMRLRVYEGEEKESIV